MFANVLLAVIAPLGWRVGEVGGQPTLLHGETPVSPVFFWQAIPSEPEFSYLGAHGVHLYSLFSSATHYRKPYWKSRDEIDISYMTDEMDRVLKLDPDACFLPRVYAIAPEWWIRENPEERLVCGGEAGVVNHESFASVKARKEVGAAFREVVRRLFVRYGDRLVGIHVANGPWGEWFTWDAEVASQKYHGENPTASDVSEPMRKAFVRYLRKKYGNDVARLRTAFADPRATFETVCIPTKAERQRLDVGVWRDPARGRRVMDYFECHHAVTVSMISHYCKIVKEVSGGKLVTSAFYGYTPEESWGLESDHRATARLYRSADVDILASPHTYSRRRPGGDGAFRQYFSSAARHGKLFVDEADDRTHLELLKAGRRDGAFSKDMNDSLGVLWRAFGNSVTRACGMWYMDVCTGNFKDRQILNVVASARRQHEKALTLRRSRCSEVAVVSNPESEFYFGYRNTVTNNISLALNSRQMSALHRTGAPFDWFLADDLDAVVKWGYKVVVFLDCQYMTPSHLHLARQLQGKGRTLVWMHAPGYAAPDGLSVPRMEALTGFRLDRADEGKIEARDCETGQAFGLGYRQLDLFLPQTRTADHVLGVGTEGALDGIPVVVERSQGDWKSVFASVPGLSDRVLRGIFRRAGVHVYSDAGVVVSANSGWLMVHAPESGVLRLDLPQKFRCVKDVVSGREAGRDIRSFEWRIARHETAVFRLER